MFKNVSLLHSDTNKMLSLFNIPFVLLSSPEHEVVKGKLLGYVIVSHLSSTFPFKWHLLLNLHRNVPHWFFFITLKSKFLLVAMAAIRKNFEKSSSWKPPAWIQDFTKLFLSWPLILLSHLGPLKSMAYRGWDLFSQIDYMENIKNLRQKLPAQLQNNSTKMFLRRPFIKFFQVIRVP